MSFSSEYAALRKKRKKNEEEEASGTSAKTSKKSSFAEQYAELRSKRSSSVAEDDDIAPVRNYGTRLYSNGIKTFALDDIAPVTDDRETYAKTLAYRKFDEQQAMLKLAFKKKLEDEAAKDPANRIEQIREANKGKTQEQIKMESQFSAIAAENEAKKAEEEKKKAFESMIENENNKSAKQRELEREIEKDMLKREHSIAEQKEAKEEEKRTWFQAEAFEDGYDFGDVTKSVGATLGDIGVNAFQGLASMGEGIIDFSIYASDLTRVKKRPIFYNAQTGEKFDIDEDLREWAQKDVVDDFVAPAKEWLDGASFLGDKSDSVAQGLGQIAGIYLTGGLGEAAGLGSAGATALTTGMMFASSAGSGIGEAYASGASDKQAMAYGVLKGLADAGSELIFGGIGKGINALGVSRGISSLDDMFAKKLSDGISNQVVKNFVEYGVKSSAEGFEEVLAGLGTAVAQKLTYMSDEELSKLIDDQDLFEQFVVGTVTSALAQSGYIPGMKKGSLRESNKTGRDFITGYTQSEQSVIDRVLEDRISEMEEAGEELSEKDKKKLLEEVQSDLERGYISTDVIDEVIGGDSYKAWRDADTKENEILEEYERLADTPSEKLSLNEQKRRDELDSRIEELRKKTESSRLRAELDNKLSAQLKGSRLDTSYIERGRKREAFTADLSHYENEAAKKSIQNLIDAKYANNTRAVHDFADAVAKLAEASGKVFSFVNNEQIREMGKAIEGRIVNGFITSDGVAVNLDSPKAWEFIVGHEITHSFEKAKSYSELHDALKAYAQSKGEWDSRFAELTELYEGQDADVEAELVADLVGEYLFGDTDFISSLAAKNPNVFQKIYAAIKHLLKTVTAGSKQARQLERAKYAFEKAMRESGKAKVDGTEYSLSGDEDFYLDDEILLEEEILSENNVNKNEIAEAYGGDGSVNNENPTLNPDIRYSLSSMGYTFFGNENTDKMRFQNRDYKETEGYTESRQFVRWFGDWKNNSKNASKIVNADGTPKIVYHQTDRDFTVFDNSTPVAGKNDSETPNGFFFKDNDHDIGIGGSKQMAVYLDMKNPLRFASREDANQWYCQNISGYASLQNEMNEALSPISTEMDNIENEMFSDEVTDEQYEILDQKWNELLDKMKSVENDFRGRLRKLLDDYFINGSSGYDGIILDYDGHRYVNGVREDVKTYIVFKRTQIKSATDNIGTYDGSNPDINYSLSYENEADANADKRLNNVDDMLPVREDANVQESAKDARSATDEDVMPMPEAEQRIDLKYLMEEDDTLSVREDAPAKEPGERQTRIDEIFNALHGKASNRYYKVMGYGVYVGRHKTTDNATITIKKPNGENIREQVEGGRHWSNDQLYTYAAELIADAEGYVADTTLPVIEDAQTANASETAEDVPSTTVRKRLETKKGNYETELEANKANRAQAWANYDAAIAEAQAEYDGLKNKNTKRANNLLRRIDRYMRQQKNVDADYAKRISDLEARIGRTDAELQKDHTRADNLERAFARIDNELAKKKAALAESFAQRRAELTRQIGNRNAFISSEAGKLYDELTNLRKGVRASKDLGYLLDLGYDWKSLKAALAHARAFPDRVVNTTSEVEAVVRESLLRSYEARTEELADLENEQSRAEAQLDMEAEIERDSARKAEDILRRTEVHENYVNEMKAEFSAQGYDLDTVLRRAKNLSTFATVDNTPQRVMQKSLGYKEGDILADITVNRVAQNETEAIKWLNSFTDRKNGVIAKLSKKYNIKPGSKQSMAAQMYAEGYYVNEQGEYITYGDHELAADFPNVKVQENIKGLARDPIIRRIYDETLDAINDSRVRNAYPEIQRLNNYFLHFQAMDDAFSRLGIPFNPNDIKAKDLPTDINGMTADLKPGQPYFASARHRLGIRTTFDLLGGLEKYLTSAKNQIYHIDDIQRLRALRNYIADDYGQAKGLESLDALTEEEAEEKIKQVFGSHLSTFAKFLNEEANILAGKTALIDRGLEGIIGRRGLTFIGDVNKQVGANQVGFNLGSSLTNFLALVQAFAKMNKFDFMKGFTQTVANRLGSIIGKGDGFENSVMVRREGAHRFHRTAWQKMSDPGYALMGAVDSISTEIIARAKYNELTRKNKDMTPEQAHFETDKWVSALMGDRSLGQMPQIYNSRMLGLITKYQLEVRNQLDSMVYDTIQETKLSNEEINNKLIRNAKTAAKVASTWFTLAVAQNLFGKVFESIVGYNPAFDIIEAISAAMGWDDDDDSEDTVLDNIEEGFLTLLEDLPYSSLILDGGRIPISGALPIGQLVTGENDYGQEVSRLDTVKEALPYYVMPAGYGQLKKTVAGLKMFDSDLPVSGSYMDKGALRFPVEKTPWNVAQAALFGQWASENARDYFDNERKPLEEKQINEYIDSEMTIQEYWNYRAGLSGLKTLEEKADYINSLDIPLWKKNLFINNIADRKEDINMEDYGEYGSLEEFDFANEYPEKYAFFKDNGISYNDYDAADKVTKSAYDWAAKDEDRYAFLEGEGISLEDPSAFDSEEEKNAYTWAYKNPEKYAVAKAVSGDVVTYKKYTGELSGIKADKDENGKSISGSRKEKVLDYINGLDIDYGEKIILFKNEYNADDTYNYDIINYLNSRDDISYSEMETILKELGFDVDSEGNVSW